MPVVAVTATCEFPAERSTRESSSPDLLESEATRLPDPDFADAGLAKHPCSGVFMTSLNNSCNAEGGT